MEVQGELLPLQCPQPSDIMWLPNPDHRHAGNILLSQPHPIANRGPMALKRNLNQITNSICVQDCGVQVRLAVLAGPEGNVTIECVWDVKSDQVKWEDFYRADDMCSLIIIS